MSRGRDILTRRGLRDLVILLSAVSAVFYTPSPAMVSVAFVLLSLGSFIHFVSKGVLIRNEVLCRDGVYSIVRHPYYLANYLVDSGFCALSGNAYLLLAYPFLFFWSYGPTLRKEEGMLTEKHPGPSVAFILGTPPVFPDRLSIGNVGALFAGFSMRRISIKEAARIVRFYAMAFLILAVGRIAAAGSGRFHPVCEPSTLMPLLPAVILYALSLVILAMRKRRLAKA